MAKAAKKPEPTEAQILEISQGEVTISIIGLEPLILNRMAEKAKRTLLMGGGRKNAAELAANVKHDPIAEFQASAYRNYGDAAPTRLNFPSAGLKGTMKTAALDMPGSTKTAIGRRIWIPGHSVDVYGIPQLLMSVVRSADIAKTPDIRTRAIVPAWCCTVTIRFAQPLVTSKQIAALFAAGGLLCGVGDWRQEKGSGSYGQFRLCDPNAADFRKIVATGGRAAQDKALAQAVPYDTESAELLEFYQAEILRRGRERSEPAAKKGSGKGKVQVPAFVASFNGDGATA